MTLPFQNICWLQIAMYYSFGHEMLHSFYNLTHNLDSQSLLNFSSLVDKREKIFLRAVLSDKIVVSMCFIGVKTLDNVGVVEGPQYFYLIFQHSPTRRTVVLEVNDFDCTLIASSAVYPSVNETAKTFSYFLTDIIYIGTYSLLLRKEPRALRNLHRRYTMPQCNFF